MRYPCTQPSGPLLCLRFTRRLLARIHHAGAVLFLPLAYSCRVFHVIKLGFPPGEQELEAESVVVRKDGAAKGVLGILQLRDQTKAI